MRWFAAKCPVSADEQRWIDRRLPWCAEEFGTMWLQTPVVLPTDDFFADPYTGAERDLRRAATVVHGHMGVPSTRLRVVLDADAPGREYTAVRSTTVSGITGMTPSTASSTSTSEHRLGSYRRAGGKGIIALDGSLADRPLLLIATIARLVAADRLIGEKRVKPDRADVGALTDLLTIYLGFGVLTANMALDFTHLSDPESPRFSQWTARRTGHLTEPMYGYALACYARMRGESKPPWARHLDTNPRTYLRRSLRYLKQR